MITAAEQISLPSPPVRPLIESGSFSPFPIRARAAFLPERAGGRMRADETPHAGLTVPVLMPVILH